MLHKFSVGLLLLVSACAQQVPGPPELAQDNPVSAAPAGAALVSEATRHHLLDSVTARVDQAQRAELDGGKDCQSIRAVEAPARSGTAFKHTIKRCGYRAELAGVTTEIGRTYWYGWSLYFPEDYQPTSEANIVDQWAAYPTPRNGKFACGGNGHKLSVSGSGLRFDLQHPSAEGDLNCDKVPLAPLSALRGQWTDFVMQAKWTGDGDGFLDLWMRTGDGAWTHVINHYTGPTWWNDEDKGPFFKMGYYVGKGHTGWTPSSVTLYSAQYRLASGDATFEDVAPSGGR